MLIVIGIALIAVAALVQFAVMSVPAALLTVGGILIVIGLLQGDIVVPRR